ncbi:MAG TPA: antibiotic biosynthesis monooxygenase [Candidatus Acidoferrales bacterium]|jgi:quinol monooxygenase YgiN|nr:antibiotic biosynthesis monooxygenase [Candidatus Acidoferrales bacterium]
MYARMWRFTILPGKLDEFVEAVRTFLPEAKKERGFRGFILLRTLIEEPKAQCTMIGLWHSRAHLRASDEGLFLPRALAHLITCCDGYPVIQEQDVLFSEIFTPRRSADFLLI